MLGWVCLYNKASFEPLLNPYQREKSFMWSTEERGGIWETIECSPRSDEQIRHLIGRWMAFDGFEKNQESFLKRNFSDD